MHVLLLHEIFDLSTKPTAIAIEQLCDDIDTLGFVVKDFDNYDHALVVRFARQSDRPVEGELRVDRIRQVFDIVALSNGSLILPASGDWDLVIDYLTSL